MTVTRRVVLQSSTCGIAAALASSSVWPQAETPKRISIAAFSANPVKVEQLRTLFRKMREKRASDPASYFFQGAVHWLPDLSSGSVALRPDLKVLAQMYNSDPAASQMLGYWEQCTHLGVKSAADFLLWHRAFLYYFEQHAKATLGDPKFTLPYWDYNDQEQSRQLPSIFVSAKVNGADNHLYPLGGLKRRLDSSTKTLSKDDVSTTNVMLNDYYFSEPGIEGMGDDIGEGTAIDDLPHGRVHGSIGGWMGDVTTAAFDPVFWIHHCNVDRLFNQWMARKRLWSRSMTPRAIEAWLDGRPYTFFGASGSLETKPRGFFLDQRNLGYAYDSDPPVIYPPEPPGPHPSAAVAGAVDAMGLDKSIKGFVLKPAGGLSEAFSISASSGGAARVPLALPSPSTGAVPGPVPLAVQNQASSKFNRTYVLLSDIRKAGELGGNYGVFVGPLAESAKDASSPSYVGRFSSFEAPAVGQARPGYRRRFDITGIVSRLAGGSKDLIVRVVPMQNTDSIGTDAPGRLVMKIDVQSGIASQAPVR